MVTKYNRQQAARRAKLLPHQPPGANAASGAPALRPGPSPAWVYPVAAVVLALLWYASGGATVDDEQLGADIYCDAVAQGHIRADRAHLCPAAGPASAP